MDYPCRYYGAGPNGEEILFAFRVAGLVDERRWLALIDELVGVTGKVFTPADAWWFEEADESIGRIDVALSGEWALLYQNLGFPGLDDFGPIEEAARVFVRHAANVRAIEIVALFGTIFDHEADAWTEWSVRQAPPSQVVTPDGHAWKSPWDEYRAELV
ncbi:MAG: hypothetical protein AAGE52_23470 [Myxococcota bacterium]